MSDQLAPFRVNAHDAQEQHKQSPETFWAPSPAELDKIKPGINVKICADAERFWVIVTSIIEERIVGTVNNNHVSGQEYGYGDSLEFEKRHVYDILAE